MRFTINKEEFLKALNIASRPVPSKSVVPSLAFIKIVLDDDGLNLIGSNETIAILTTIPYKKGDKEIIYNYKNGAILVQGHYLVEIVRKLSGTELSFEILDSSVAEIRDEKSLFQLTTANVEEYPEYNFNEDGVNFDIKTKDLISLVDQTSFAADNKGTRPMLSALNIVGENNKVTAIALDAARFSKKEINIDSDATFVVNVPAKTINDIIKMFENSEKINITANDKKILFKFNNTIISSNLLNGEFPNVRNIIPSDDKFVYNLEVNAQEMLSAIDRVMLLTNEKSTIRLSMSSEGINISSVTNEVGSAKETINTFQYNGGNFEIFFNGSFVIDGIKALKSEDVIFKFVGEMKPFVIKSVTDNSIIEVITPVRG